MSKCWVFLKNWQSGRSPLFMQPKNSLQCPQGPTTDCYPELDECILHVIFVFRSISVLSFHLPLVLPSASSFQVFLPKLSMHYVPCSPPTSSTDFNILIIYGNMYSYEAPHYIIFSLPVPNILFSTLFPYTTNIWLHFQTFSAYNLHHS